MIEKKQCLVVLDNDCKRQVCVDVATVTCLPCSDDSCLQELIKRNAMINLPYVTDGDEVVTQSNSVLLYVSSPGVLR